jgi:hypothetical protein
MLQVYHGTEYGRDGNSLLRRMAGFRTNLYPVTGAFLSLMSPFQPIPARLNRLNLSWIKDPSGTPSVEWRHQHRSLRPAPANNQSAGEIGQLQASTSMSSAAIMQPSSCHLRKSSTTTW